MTGIPVLTTTEQGTDAWLAARLSGIGGSEIAALMGANPYQTPLDVYLAKTDPEKVRQPQSVAMSVGHALEPFVAGLWTEQRPGWTLTKPPALMRHPDVPCAIASLDYLASNGSETVALEVKVTGQDWTTLPARVWWQCQHQLAVTGLQRAEVVALIRTRDLRVFHVAEDPDAQAHALAVAQQFWDEHVVPRVMPDPDPGRDCATLDLLWTPEQGQTAELDPELVALWLDLKASAAALKTDLEQAEGLLKLALKDATEGLVHGQPVLTWRETKGRTMVDTDALKRAGLLERFQKQGRGYRTLRAVKPGPA